MTLNINLWKDVALSTMSEQSMQRHLFPCLSTTYAAFTKQLALRWCEKQMKGSTIWFVPSDGGAGGKKFLDGISMTRITDIVALILESSGHGETKNSQHVLKNTEKHQKWLRYLKRYLCKVPRCVYWIIKDLKVFSVQGIQRKRTQITYLCRDNNLKTVITALHTMRKERLDVFWIW